MLSDKEIADFIERNTWYFAKTYASFCPHEYVVKNRLSEEDKDFFEKFAQHIRDNGWNAVYGSMGVNKYYAVGQYYYWTMGDPIPETIILNRARFKDFNIHITSNGARKE